MKRLLFISLDPCVWGSRRKLDATRTWHIMVPMPSLRLRWHPISAGSIHLRLLYAPSVPKSSLPPAGGQVLLLLNWHIRKQRPRKAIHPAWSWCLQPDHGYMPNFMSSVCCCFADEIHLLTSTERRQLLQTRSRHGHTGLHVQIMGSATAVLSDLDGIHLETMREFNGFRIL